MNPTDPEDPENDAVIIDGQAPQGGAGVDPNVATFTDSTAQTAISLKKPVTALLSMDIQNGLIVDQIVSTALQTTSFTSAGLTVTGNGSVGGNFSDGAINFGGSCTIGGALQATGSLPNTGSIVSAGAYFGFVPTVNFCGAYLVAGSQASSSIMDFTYVGATGPHVRMSSSPSFDTFRIKQNNVDRIVLDASNCTIGSDLTTT